MVRGIESNVVDGPVSWRAPSNDPPGTEGNGSFWFHEACGGARTGPSEKLCRFTGPDSESPTMPISVKIKPQVDELSFCRKRGYGWGS